MRPKYTAEYYAERDQLYGEKLNELNSAYGELFKAQRTLMMLINDTSSKCATNEAFWLRLNSNPRHTELHADVASRLNTIAQLTDALKRITLEEI